MLHRVQDFIDRHQLLERTALHLVGLSGGADSVALLLILKALGYRIEAAHCNFRLRGDESDRDEQFVRDLCWLLEIPLHLIHFDTKSYAELHQVSIEMAARDLRYSYFRQLCQDIGATDVCIAHHRDDAVETLLMNLLRGAGIHGLTGIRPKNDIVRRPLLCLNRQEILQYLDSIGQPYVTDSTNLVPDVMRNKIRLQVLPLLEEIAPGATANIDRTANYLREAEQVFQAELSREMAELGGSSCDAVAIDRLLQLPSPETFLHEWLMPYGFNAAQTAQLMNCLDKTGSEFRSASHLLVVDRNQLVVEPVCQPMKSLKIPETGTYCAAEDMKLCIEEVEDLAISKSLDCATLDAAKVQFPLMLRPVQPGDRFVPFGMKGSKLVSDYLTDLKLSVLQKRRQLVLTDAQGAIIWLVGRRTDNRFRVSDETARILRITIKHED
ncbi:tRNA lysidine(34) synthetase TilS [Prevotella sp. P6B1]|uniref:tRNA lysidine(34) synthetase TilS n=1 Tax=Prevotella sp. P6B1 TaxID=1410613 RepID=UPI00051CA785|nr:tRNA lysidine(34) synthetase TilS [Prevotella sp. P6B1]